MKNRIGILRRADYPKRRFKEKGLDEFLTDLKLNVHEGETWEVLWKKYIRVVNRKFRLIEITPELLSLINSRPRRVAYESMDDFDSYPKLVDDK